MPSETIRGLDHIGIFVPDFDAAKTFLVEAFGAQLIYQSFGRDDPPHEGEALVRKTGIAPGSVMRAQGVLRLGRGPDIELFEMHAPDQTATTGTSHFGLNHFCMYVDDPDAAIARFEKAGGRMFSGPNEILFGAEKGDGVSFCYGVTPWGMNIEFITYPGEMGYETGTPLRRWNRGS